MNLLSAVIQLTYNIVNLLLVVFLEQTKNKRKMNIKWLCFYFVFQFRNAVNTECARESVLFSAVRLASDCSLFPFSRIWAHSTRTEQKQKNKNNGQYWSFAVCTRCRFHQQWLQREYIINSNNIQMCAACFFFINRHSTAIIDISRSACNIENVCVFSFFFVRFVLMRLFRWYGNAHLQVNVIAVPCLPSRK